MKSYKLIKEYPGLLEKGCVATLGLHGSSGECYEVKEPNRNIYRFDKETIENNPEFWEEIVEKDYEILSFRYTDTNNTNKWKKQKNGLFTYGLYSVYAVKRLSDGEIFTVGDMVKSSLYPHTIDSFRIKQKVINRNKDGSWNYDGVDRIFINYSNNEGGNWLEDTEKVTDKDFEVISTESKDNTCTSYISEVEYLKSGQVFKLGDYISSNYDAKNRDRNVPKPITKMKVNEYGNMLFYTDVFIKNGLNIDKAIKHTPLFTTEDGVELFEGDECWAVSDNLDLLYTYYTTESHEKDGKVRVFSTREAAEEFVLMNKPCYLSFEEIMEEIPFTDKDREIEKNLKELVKSKL